MEAADHALCSAHASLTSGSCAVSSISPPDRKGLLDFMLESAFAMLQHHAPTQYPARAARQSECPARCKVGFTFHVGAFVF